MPCPKKYETVAKIYEAFAKIKKNVLCLLECYKQSREKNSLSFCFLKNKNYFPLQKIAADLLSCYK